MNQAADDKSDGKSAGKSDGSRHLPKPIIKKTRWPALLIWLVPIGAAVLGCFYLLTLRQQHGLELTLKFSDVNGLKVGQTHIMHLGVDIGEVKEIILSPDQKQAIVIVRLQRSADAFARKGAMFWIVRPEISTQSISGLATVLSGPYIDAIPGNGEEQQEFTGLEKSPPTLDPGIRIVLHTPRLDRLQSDSPIYYRGIQVGVIEDIQLSANAVGVDVHAFIEQPFIPLVKTNSRFWIVSAVEVQGGLLSGLHMKVGSLSSLLSGGISFATPEDDMGEQAANGSQFALYNEPKKEWLDWAPEIWIDHAGADHKSTATTLPQSTDEIKSLVAPQ